MPPAVPSKGSSGSLLHAFSSSIAAIKSLFSSLIQAIHVDVEQFFMLCGSGKRCGNPNGRITFSYSVYHHYSRLCQFVVLLCLLCRKLSVTAVVLVACHTVGYVPIAVLSHIL